MERLLNSGILANIYIIVGVVGAIMGVDLIFGARLIKALNEASKTLVDLEQAIDSPKGRVVLGVILAALSLLMLFLIRKAYSL